MTTDDEIEEMVRNNELPPIEGVQIQIVELPQIDGEDELQGIQYAYRINAYDEAIKDIRIEAWEIAEARDIAKEYLRIAKIDEETKGISRMDDMDMADVEGA